MNEFPQQYRILYLGQKWLGEHCFAYLRGHAKSDLRIEGVVTNFSEDVWWGSNSIFQQCKSSEIPVISEQL